MAFAKSLLKQISGEQGQVWILVLSLWDGETSVLEMETPVMADFGQTAQCFSYLRDSSPLPGTAVWKRKGKRMEPKKNGFEKAQRISETVEGDTFSLCCIDFQCAGDATRL